MDNLKSTASGNCNSINPQVSVALATYNGERYIREQLASLARQSLLPLELVITDDGSNDATIDIVAEFAESAPFPVRVFQNESRLGYAENFLRCASLCNGEFVAFCDQDDIWLESKLERCLEHFEQPSVHLVVHSAQTFSGSEGQGHQYPGFNRTRTLLRSTSEPFISWPGFAMVVRRQLLSVAAGIRRPQRIHSHDQWIWFLAASVGDIVTSADVLALYRQHASNVFGAGMKRTRISHMKGRTDILDYEYMASYELAGSQVLSDLIQKAPATWKDSLEDSAGKLRKRSTLHWQRATIYHDDSSGPQRAMAFFRILISGGYLPDPTKTRLGICGGLKDLLIGVFGSLYLSASPQKQI